MVRSVLGRELRQPTDTELLMLERLRLIDMANAWASGTDDQYQLKLSIIRSFERKHRFQFLGVQPLAFPPNTIDIPIMWMQISYSLRLRPSTRRGDGSTISMATVRHLRSAAASQFLGWEMMVQNPLNTFLDYSGMQGYRQLFIHSVLERHDRSSPWD
jgi:hypothetical protein